MVEIKTPPRRLTDPSGLIERIRRRLNPRCAVARSPFCDYIISMRMQGIPWREIENWLIEQGEEHRISSPGLFKCFKNAKMEVKLSYAEEMLEKMGGVVKLDVIREMSQNVITQKERVDRLVRGEVEKRASSKEYANYVDKRIRPEMTLLQSMMKELHQLLEKTPQQAAAEAEEALRIMDQQGITVSEDAAAVLADMIINGEIKAGPSDLLPTGTTKH